MPAELDAQDELVREATRRMYSPDGDGLERPSQIMQKSQSRRPYEGEMYNSRFVNNTALGRLQNFTVDDIEKQRFRVPRHRGNGEPEVQEYSDDREAVGRRRGRSAQPARALRE